MLEILRLTASGFGALMNVTSLVLILVGVCVGILGGAIPGISPSMAVALLLPMTYTMTPTQGIVMLMGIYIGANYGGSITAVAINTPGTPSAIAYPIISERRAAKKKDAPAADAPAESGKEE